MFSFEKFYNLVKSGYFARQDIRDDRTFDYCVMTWWIASGFSEDSYYRNKAILRALLGENTYTEIARLNAAFFKAIDAEIGRRPDAARRYANMFIDENNLLHLELFELMGRYQHFADALKRFMVENQSVTRLDF